MSARLAVAAIATLAGAAAVHAADDDFLARWAATNRFRSGAPAAIRCTPAGDAVLFLRSSGPTERRQDLWTFDPRTGSERVLVTAGALLGGGAETLTAEERARRERLRLSAGGIVSFEISRDGRTLLVPLSGRLFVVDRASGRSRELESRHGAAEDARFSPDGATIACVRDRDLWTLDVATGHETRLTTSEHPDVTWGRPEFVAQEEMGRFAGYWWSPDSKHVLVQRTDTRGVERMFISDPARPEAPPQEWPYPRAGRRNADVRLFLLPASGGEPREVKWDRERFPYLCSVEWSSRGPLSVYVMNRTQQEGVLLAAEPATGATRTLLVESDPAWINLEPTTPRWLPEGRGFLWLAERGDTEPALYWHGADGRPIVRLTPPGMEVDELLHVSPDGREAVVLAHGREPAEKRVVRVDVAARGRTVPFEVSPGLHRATFSENGALRVHTLQPLRGATRWTVSDTRNRTLGEIRSLADEPPFEPNVTFERVGPDSLRCAIVRPRAFVPGRRYPVIDAVYGGPHSQQVVARGRRYLMEQWIADQGFIVIAADGRGTPGRGSRWERAIRGDLVGPALDDQCLAVRELCARHVEMDPARVGAWGWSFGGTMAAAAVLRRPDVFRAAVAGAPVVDWRDYDTFYTERYLGLPGPDSLAYERSSLLPDAAKLARPLLIVHGTADDNVYFFNSLRLADALNRAGRAFDFLPLPGRTHSVTDAAYVRRVHTAVVEYFQRHLGGPGDAAPPRE